MNRRKLLVVGGFGAATVLGLSRLDAASRFFASGSTSAEGTTNVIVREPDRPVGPTTMEGAQAAPPGHTFERVIANGRVIDPATGYDQVANVGIDDGTITAISTDPLVGTETLDATGMVVSPGFIDVLSYEPVSYGVWYKVADGVTTNLGMHGINDTASSFFDAFGAEGNVPPIHYGGAFDDPHMRSVVAKIPTRAATPAQIGELERLFEQGISDGWMGVDVEPEYTPWVEADEITALGAVAAKYQLPLFSHIRWSYPGTAEEGSLAAIDELLKVAQDTGVGVHVDHITSMATHVIPEAIAKIDAARASGLDVTACMYPYDFWATSAGSARFADGWQERFGITYRDLEIPGVGEPLDESTFARARRDKTLVAAHAIPAADVEAALQAPWVMIGSDAILEPGNNNHPRATGCFTRLLGHYVRELNVLSLRDGLAKMTILPARRLEARSPQMQRKGRLQIGADADITVFDPTTVADASTLADPAQEAVGVRHVLVLGTVVRRDGVNDTAQTPGQPIKPSV